MIINLIYIALYRVHKKKKNNNKLCAMKENKKNYTP